ncbi:winged helix-turn-helix transcriptional regulator [Acidithiobacillus sp. CV18-2]|nr:winged helix-turn-helix transcriptional regulator [Acidithiobacillus sp. CV18-3]MBU2756879.1 winged helix-turn-helix transcriptional regulator [Acidithiobacillus sp. BN09-2]MBU2778023.1 winged helix-turn-helix transcriptional regulator [Acidithiobacillus sp. CV18-2]MBU2799590.1 winged helix-turn-helix transcriptional regulator [Acidithiobacillus sp. VAN18-4]
MNMGMGMMKKMGQMGSGGGGPMAMMQKMMGQKGESSEAEGENPMQHMMGMCMEMHTEMLATIQKTNALAVSATPALQPLFLQWLDTLSEEVLQLLQKQPGMESADLAKALQISAEGATYLLASLCNQGKIRLRAEGTQIS